MTKIKQRIATFLCFFFCFTVLSGNIVHAQGNNTTHGAEAYEYVKYLDTNLRERIAGTQQEINTATYIQSELESFGYQVTVTPFTYTRRGEDKNGQNLSLTKPGNSTKKIIVGAHYDSVGTAGVDDNGSGVAVVLETAKKFKTMETPYTIEFVFFGAEEVGLIGSQAFIDAMTTEEIKNTILMVNLDSLLAGTYPYIYGGVVETNSVVDTFGVDQAKELSDKLGLNLRLNNTSLNIDYPSPSTGSWSDHASFSQEGIPYLYLEASNWELPDNPNKPEEGSSGAYQTKTGPVMHKVGRDDLSFIEQEWGDRGKNHLSTYSTFLYHYLPLVSPQGLLADKTQLKTAITAAEKVDTTLYTKESVAAFHTALENAKTMAEDDTILATAQQDVDNAILILTKAQQNLKLLSSEKPDPGEKDKNDKDDNKNKENTTPEKNKGDNTNNKNKEDTTQEKDKAQNTTSVEAVNTADNTPIIVYILALSVSSICPIIFKRKSKTTVEI